jgi:hypothetical protein
VSAAYEWTVERNGTALIHCLTRATAIELARNLTLDLKGRLGADFDRKTDTYRAIGPNGQAAR